MRVLAIDGQGGKIPGIICHIALIPPVVLALRKAKILRVDIPS